MSIDAILSSLNIRLSALSPKEFKLHREIIALQKEGEKKGLYYLVNSQKAKEIFNGNNSLTAKKFFLELYGEWDKYGEMPLDVGNMLEEMVNDKDNILAIHRMKIYDIEHLEDDEVLYQILTNGLKNMGDLMSSGLYNGGIISPNKTTSTVGLLEAIVYPKTSYSDWKETNTSILISYPADCVDSFGDVVPGMEDKIYYRGDDGTLYFLPELIVGVITQNHGKCKYYSREELLNNSKCK